MLIDKKFVDEMLNCETEKEIEYFFIEKVILGKTTSEQFKKIAEAIYSQNELKEYFMTQAMTKNKFIFAIIMHQANIKIPINVALDIINSSDLEKYESSETIKMYLIEVIEDNDYKEKIIDDKIKIKGVLLNFYNKFALTLRLTDDEYKKQIIEDKKRINKERIRSYNQFLLIKSLKDEEYKKKAIEDNIEGVKLYGYLKLQLIKKINDDVYKKTIIEGKRIIPSLELNNQNQLEIIESLQDDEYKKEIIEGKREILGLELNNQNQQGIIKSLQDDEYKKEIIEGKREIAKFELTDDNKFELIKSLQDNEYKKQLLEKRNWSNIDKLRLIVTITDDEYQKNKTAEIIAESIESVKEMYMDNSHNMEKINLPPNMTIGIEIETIGEFAYLFKRKFLGFQGEGDSTLQGKENESGLEAVSGILHSKEKDIKNIYYICQVLSNNGFYTNSTCGGHVHIGADYLTSEHAWNVLIDLWNNTEKIIYAISNQEGKTPRQGILNFADTLSKRTEMWQKKGIHINETSRAIDNIKKIQANKYIGINFLNVGTHKNTIEFRVSNATLNPQVWVENINLYGGIVRAVEEISNIQRKNEEDKTEEEKEKLKAFEAIIRRRNN